MAGKNERGIKNVNSLVGRRDIIQSNNMRRPNHQFKIVFDGDVEKVDVNVLIATLLNTTNVLNEISREIDPHKKLSIQIEPFAPGSFEIIYSLLPHGFVGDLLTQITSSDTIGYLSDLVTILGGLFGLKQLLKGKKPEKIEKASDKTTIQAQNGSVISVDNRIYNIYANNACVNDGIIKTFKALEEHEQIEDFKLLSQKEKPLFEAHRSEFRGMQEKNELIGEDLEIVTIPDAKLFLHKIVFTQDNKWGFIYEGNKIGAFIRDSIFFEKLEDHAFNIGDFFVAELRITRKYDPIIKAYLNDSYEVLEVKAHQKMPSQKKFNFDK